MTAQLSVIARKLVELEHLSIEQAQELQEKCKEANSSFITEITKKQLMDPVVLLAITAREFGIPALDIDFLDTSHAPNFELKGNTSYEDLHAVPIFQRGKKVFVAISDPSDLKALDELNNIITEDVSLEPILVEDNKLISLLKKMSTTTIDNLDDSLNDLEISAEIDDERAVDITQDDSTPVVKFVNKTLLDAINQGASDIHFEPYEKFYRIRLRQDGILNEYATPPVNLATKLAARLKVISSLDISEKRVPQDGRFKIKISKTNAIDFRISTCPTLYGEKIVMRILDPSSAQLGIDALGYEAEQKENFLDAIHKPQGMVLVTGPTGSGKTVSLYTALNILNTPKVNISTAEDPVEINLPGINQVNINPKSGLLFATALKSFLRQDPDIIMLGEIRDLETASIAIKAAQTGHMVLSTLHTNSAPETLVRLINMGVPAYNLASSINLIIAQRLARRLCDKCKEQYDVPINAKIEMGFSESEAEEVVIYKAVGCAHCKSGYKGRVGLYEVMPISPQMSQIIMEGADAIELAKQARKEGIGDIKRAGLNKIKEGITTIEECSRVSS